MGRELRRSHDSSRPSAAWLAVFLLLAATAWAAGPLRGVEAVPGILPWHDEAARHVNNATERPLSEPVTLLLSKQRYPFEDGHLDAVLWLAAAKGQTLPGHLDVRLFGPDGRELSAGRIESPPDSRIFFSYDLPEALAGQSGRLAVRWVRDGETVGQDDKLFEVAPAAPVQRSDRVRLTVPNDSRARIRQAPMTVGVPFPRGALHDAGTVRLVNAAGTEVPLQTEVTARWSRFGSVKWLQCDFSADIEGDEAAFYLEYGPDVRRSAPPQGLEVQPTNAGFPAIEAGRLDIRDDGLYFDPAGDGSWQRVLAPDALLGAFVRHEDGRTFRMPADTAFEVEEQGSEKVSLLAQGYYREPGTGHEFCLFNTRYVVHRDSPVLRIVHTWIFTGDGNADRIRNMGWRFGMDGALSPDGFLDAFGPDGQWRQGDYLLQHDFDKNKVVENGLIASEGRRAPGVAAASGGGVRIFFGAKDFWQNYPSELEFSDGVLYFHNWPRHGRPAMHSPATVDNAVRLWFVHEGEALDFRIPDEYAQDPIWQEMSAGRGAGMHWLKGQPETANAQGIARTEEMWLYFAAANESLEQASATMEGLNAETLRPYVDPKWMAASGAFHEIHHRDLDKYAEHEEIYEEVALAPWRWNERIGIYGMWIYGDNLWGPYLHTQSADLYRAFRKSHHRWPYSWIPYVRSGDARFLRYAQAATRQMYDANYCHYATEDVDESVGPRKFHVRGMQWKSLAPWAGQTGPTTRAYHHQVDYLWHAFYTVNDRRSLDVIRSWQEDVKVEKPIPHHGPIVGGTGSYPHRQRVAMHHAAVDMYEAAFDPWFLVLAHAIAELDMAEYARGWRGHPWRPGPRDFLRFTGDPTYKEFYLDYAKNAGSEHTGGWGGGPTQIESNAYAWWLTRDEQFLRRLAHLVDWARQSTYMGTPEHYKGYHVRGSAYTSAPIFTCWYLYQFPLALAAFEAAGKMPVPLPNRFVQGGEEIVEQDGGGYLVRMVPVAFRKAPGEALPLRLEINRMRNGQGRYELRGPGGGVFMQGQWEEEAGTQIELPADAPAGTYRLLVEARVPGISGSIIYPTGLKVPVTPAGTPEVLLPESPEFRRAVFQAQYWFMTPQDAQTFEARFREDGHDIQRRPPVRRMSVWDADGRMVWDHNMITERLREEIQVEAEVEVPPDQRGRLWRITLPGRNLGFRIATPVQPVFAVSPDRWFDPDAEE